MITQNRLYDFELDGVNINKKALDLKPVTTLGALQALNIFAHRSGQQKTDDENELLARLETFNGTYTTDDIIVPHTNGVLTSGVAISNAKRPSTFGANMTYSNSLGRYVFTPYDPTHMPIDDVLSMDTIAQVNMLKVYTNIVANDASTDFDPGSIVCWYDQAYQSADNSGTTGQRMTINFYKTVGTFNGSPNHTQTFAVSSGPNNSPPLIGDVGTFYGSNTNPDKFYSDKSLQIGVNTDFPFLTYHYICFGFQIPAAAVTKTYKFRFELDYDIL